MVFLPIIANNLGKIATASAAILGLVGFVNREQLGRWLADEEPDSKERGQVCRQDTAGVLETAESLKNIHGHHPWRDRQEAYGATGQAHRDEQPRR